jgi:hypothetical protein
MAVESELLTSNLKLSVIRIGYEQLISLVEGIVNVLQSCDTPPTVLLLVRHTGIGSRIDIVAFTSGPKRMGD